MKKPFIEVLRVEEILQIGMGKGEREAISLALELDIKTILIDDLRAMRKAAGQGLFPLTAFDIIISLKRTRLIHSVKSALDKMIEEGEGIDNSHCV